MKLTQSRGYYHTVNQDLAEWEQTVDGQKLPRNSTDARKTKCAQAQTVQEESKQFSVEAEENYTSKNINLLLSWGAGG